MLYGIFRYLYLVHQKRRRQPADLLVTDRPLLAASRSGRCVVLFLYFLADYLRLDDARCMSRVCKRSDDHVSRP